MAEASNEHFNAACQHGGLRRKCEICERDAEIERLQRELADWKQADTDRCLELFDVREKHGNALIERDRLRGALDEVELAVACGGLSITVIERVKAVLKQRLAHETPARTDSERLQWLANTLLCSDYGDNAHPGKLIGWRVMEFIAPVIYGRSLEEAIDAGMDDELNRRRKRQMKPTVEGLEKLLQAEDSTPVQVLPDGSVRPMPAVETSAPREESK